MFTGIVETTAQIESKKKIGKNIRIALSLSKKWKLKEGDSVAVAGVCLTVAEISDGTYFFDMIPETLSKTIFGKKMPSIVNVERPMVYGARVHGHIVSGHVSCVGTVSKVTDDAHGYRIEISYPKKFAKYVVSMGSIVVDGCGLTIAQKKPAAFIVALVPHTRKITTLSNLTKGDIVNLEFNTN